MKAVGGFFDLEVPPGSGPFHSEAMQLSTGRACVHQFAQVEKPQLVLLPYHCCNALHEPFDELNIPYRFYEIDAKLEPVDLPAELPAGTWLLYTNFYGMKNNAVDELLERYPERVIVDDTHRFFHRGYPAAWSFTSARKHFGVPDGAYAYAPKEVRWRSLPRFVPPRLDHLVARATTTPEAAYEAFRRHEATLGAGAMRMSVLSERLLAAIDYEEVRARRRRNTQFVAEALQNSNQLQVPSDVELFCYPYLPERALPLATLHAEQIFLPSYWMDTTTRSESGFEWEKRLSTDVLNIPVDHRYEPADLRRVVGRVQELLKA